MQWGDCRNPETTCYTTGFSINKERFRAKGDLKPLSVVTESTGTSNAALLPYFITRSTFESETRRVFLRSFFRCPRDRDAMMIERAAEAEG